MPKCFVVVALVLALGGTLGCGAKSADTGPQNAAEFRSLVTLYYAMARNGERPKDEADFKSRIRGNLAPMAEKLAVTDVDGLFTSKRDGKPLVIAYGPAPASPGGKEVIAYEQEGIDGKRLVGFSMGMTEEADQARFDELVPKKK